jgi:hypothetical protein
MSGLDDAKRQLGNVFDSEAHGVTVVLRSATINRLDLIAWMMDDFASDYDPGDGFAALYLCDQLEQLELVRERLRVLRHERGEAEVDDIKIVGQNASLPPRLPAFTYVSDVAFDRVSEQFAARNLDLFIVDERRDGVLAPHYEFVESVKPDLTIFVTKQALPGYSPWRRLEKILHLGNPHQNASPSRRRSR